MTTTTIEMTKTSPTRWAATANGNTYGVAYSSGKYRIFIDGKQIATAANLDNARKQIARHASNQIAA